MNFPDSLSLVDFSSSTTLVGFVYRVFHVENGCSYIGQTQRSPPSVRYKKHFWSSSSGAPKLQAAMKELGRTKFKAEVIETHRADSHSELDILLRTREAILIEEYDAIENGYNCTSHRPGNTPSDKALWKIITERRRKHSCNECPYRACSEASLRIHKNKTHNGPLPFPCTLEGCAYRTIQLWHLKEHMRRHTGEKPYACTWEDCVYKSVQLGNLQTHMRTHTGEKPYACSWKGCVYKSVQSGNLQRHMRSHTGEKPYECTWEGCTFKSVQSGHLREHNQRHTGVKPYACTWEGCGYKAVKAKDVEKHMRIHTGEKPYACSWKGCVYKSVQSGNLHRHMRRHTGEKPYAWMG